MFTDSYDANSELGISRENFEKKLTFRFTKQRKSEILVAQYNVNMSPNASDFLQRLVEFKQEFGFYQQC